MGRGDHPGGLAAGEQVGEPANSLRSAAAVQEQERSARALLGYGDLDDRVVRGDGEGCA